MKLGVANPVSTLDNFGERMVPAISHSSVFWRISTDIVSLRDMHEGGES